jgi:hypothetical protein
VKLAGRNCRTTLFHQPDYDSVHGLPVMTWISLDISNAGEDGSGKMMLPVFADRIGHKPEANASIGVNRIHYLCSTCVCHVDIRRNVKLQAFSANMKEYLQIRSLRNLVIGGIKNNDLSHC